MVLKMANTISHHQPNPERLDFSSLRKDGIESIQQLCGHYWTDFNEHDPGVTILEQLCYGLTDLAYRTDFDIQDYLINDSYHHIDFEQQALYKPEDVFPSNAVTITDWCKLLYSEIPEIENLEMQFTYPGIYHLSINLYDSMLSNKHTFENVQKVQNHVLRIFHENRNLCEALDKIEFSQPPFCSLEGCVVIQNHADIPQVYSEIYFKVARILSSNIHIERYDAMLKQGYHPDDLFNGPLTPQGYLKDSDFLSANQIPDLSQIMAEISKIAGVQQILDLQIHHANEQTDEKPTKSLKLRLPDLSQNDSFLRIIVANQDITINESFLDKCRKHLAKHEFSYQAFRHSKNFRAQLNPLPKGSYRNFAEYSSIQEHFPDIYGINHAGVPRSASEARKTQAKQLKSYLFPLEQIMSNYLETLDSIPDLFSLNHDEFSTYPSQVIADKALTTIDGMYHQNLEDTVPKITQSHESLWERKNQIADYMLHLLGQTFPDDMFLKYNENYSNKTHHWLTYSKINLLKKYRDLSKYRSGGENHYAKQHRRPKGFWQQRLECFLGIPNEEDTQKIYRTIPKSLKFIPDIEYRKKFGLEVGEPYSEEAFTIPSIPIDQETAGEINLSIHEFNEQILAYGGDLNAYRWTQESSKEIHLFYKQPDTNFWLYLKTFEDTSRTFKYANHLKNLICNINRVSEGFYVFEPALFTPYCQNHPDIKIEEHLSTLMIAFPGFLARFKKNDFQEHCVDLIRENLPAHLSAQIFWLDLESLLNFQTSLRDLNSLLHEFIHAKEEKTELLTHEYLKMLHLLDSFRESSHDYYWI